MGFISQLQATAQYIYTPYTIKVMQTARQGLQEGMSG